MTFMMVSLLNSLTDFSQLSPEFKGSLLAIISAFCWAASASVYKKGLESTDAWSGNLMRTGFATVGFFLVMVVKGTLSSALTSLTVSLFFWVIFSAFFAFFLGDLLFLISIKRVGVSRTVPVSSTYPLFVTVWAFIVYGKSVSIFVVLGTLLIVVAIKLISEEGEKKGKGEREPNAPSRGVFLAISAAVCWSISVVVLDYLVLVLPTEAVAGFRFFITFLLTAAVVSTRTFTYDNHSLFWIGVGGFGILVFSNYIFLEAIRMVGSTKAAPISAVYPVISIVLAALFLKEKITVKIVGGTVLSFLGVLLVMVG